MAKYKIYVNGTQTPQNTQNNQLVQQIAQNTANQQLQNQAQAQAEATDPMRQSVNDYLKNKLLNNVEMPRFTTVQDILDAPKGSKLETFGQFLGNNPDITRLVNGIVGGTYYDRFGRLMDAGEETARQQEARMQAEQAKALQQIKEQNDIATSLNSIFNQRDIADQNDKRMRELAKEEMEFKRQENALNRALQREHLNATIQHQRAMEGIARERLNGNGLTGGAAGLNEKQLKNLVVIDGKGYYIPAATSADKGKIRDNNAIIASLDEGLEVIKNNPKAFGLKGVAPAVVQSELGSKAGNKARSQIGGLAKEYKKYLTGVASNKTEEKDFLRYVPAPFDTADTLEAKIEAIRNISKSKNKGILNTYYYKELDNFGGGINSYNDGWAF